MTRRGQGVLEYVILAGFLAAALIATGVYMKRGFQGNLRSQTEQLGAGFYAPGNTTTNTPTTQIKTAHAQVTSSSTATTTYGNGQSQTSAITQKTEDIKNFSDQLTALQTQQKAAMAANNWTLVDSLGVQISAKQQELTKAQQDLKDLQKAYDARTIIPNQTTVTTSDTGNGNESITRNTNESLGRLSDDQTTTPDTGSIAQPPVVLSGPFLNAQTLGCGSGFPYPGLLFQSGERKYFKFTVPEGAKSFSASIASYDQTHVMNMIVVKGNPPADVFDTVYQNHVANGWGVTGYANSTTINNTQVWDRMTNNPYGQNLYVFDPAPGDYYLIVQTDDTGSNHLDVGVGC